MGRVLVDRGIDWVGLVPESWKFKKGKYLFQQRSERGNTIELQLLSPTQKFGCIPQSMYEELTGANAVKLNDKTDLRLLKTIHVGDYCISLRSFQGGFEYSNYEGVVSPAYQVFYPIHENVCRGYYKYMFKDGAFIDKMNSFTLSLRDGKNIAFADFGNTLLPLPSIEEQQAIADYLDKKTAEIDAAIFEAKELIDKYKAYKQSVITETVTKGLNPDVKLKNSNVDWIGEIPEHWNTNRLGNFYILRNEKVSDKQYPPLSVTKKGILPQLETAAKTDDGDNRKLVKKGDFAINSRSDRRGSCGISEYEGSVSLINTVLCPRDKMNAGFYNWTFHSSKFSDEFYKWGHGIVDDLWTTRWSDMKNINVAVPPLEEQKEISDYLDDKCVQIDTIIAQKENLISQLQEYKKSVIFEYVTGKKEVPNG